MQRYRDLFTTAAGAGQAPIWQSSPLVLDLNGDGVQTTALTSGAFFDLDANGFAEQTGWVDPHDGLLVRDLNGNGTIDDGGELFGDHTVLTNGTTAPNGFEALNDLDENGDGKLDAADAAWTQLKIWRDGDGDGRSAGDELHALGEFQITALDLTYHHSSDRDAAGNDHWHQGQFTMGGVTRAMDDVWFKTDPTLTLATQWLDVPAAIAVLPDAQGFGNVSDLHQAMVRDTSGALQELVEAFVSQPDPAARSALVDPLLVRWTGSAGLDPASRGPNIDARQLAVLEKFYGEGFQGRAPGWLIGQPAPSTPNPNPEAAGYLKESYQGLQELLYAQLMAQTHLQSLYNQITYRWDDPSQALKADLSAVMSTLDSRLQSADATVVATAKGDLSELARTLRGVQAQAMTDYWGFRSHYTSQSEELGWLVDSGGRHITIDTQGVNNAWGFVSGSYTAPGTPLNDAINGGAGNDQIEAGGIVVGSAAVMSGDDVIYGGPGNDYLGGLDGDDILVGGDGDDTLGGWVGNDVMEGGTGKDALYGDMGDDVLDGGDGDDTLYDSPYSNSGNDVLRGGAGKDTLDAGWGNDTLSGGPGDGDMLQGGIDGDTYLFNRGDGQDTIVEASDPYGPADTIQLGAGIAPGEVRLEGINGDLRVSLTGTTDSVTVRNGLGYNGYYSQVERLQFADGTAWTLAYRTDLLNTVIGTGASDNLVGYIGPNHLRGLEGNDTLSSSSGDDVLEGGDGADTLQGGPGNDVLTGGPGNDVLRGDTGTDTYLFALGDGQDTITDYDTTAGNNDTIQLGAGIAPGEVRLDGINNDLVISFTGSPDSRTIKNWFYSDMNWYKVERLQFADGTVWNLGSRTDLVNTFTGTSGNDYLSGGSEPNVIQGFDGADVFSAGAGNDILDGGAGNDTVSGGLGNDLLKGGDGNDTLSGDAGDDVLQGGPGNDTLDGGYGADVYVFNLGDGQDTITNYDPGSGDTLRLGPGIVSSDVQLQAVGSDMVLNMTGTTDTVTVKNWGVSSDYRIDRLLFEDGTERNIGSSGTVPVTGTNGNDVLYGGADPNVLQGLAGNDSLSGGSGDDVLVGGPGNDTLDGGYGHDSYQFNPGEGQDVINNYDPYGSGDAIRLGVGILPGDARLNGINNDLQISFISSTDSVVVKNWFYLDDYKVEVLQFADGTAWNLANRTDIVNTVTGTAGNDWLSGYAAADTLRGLGGNDSLSGGVGNDGLEGGSGNDTLSGGAGDDVLQGGSGNDTLDGGYGADTYVFNIGDGQDTITDYDATLGTTDVIQLGAGIDPAAVQIQGLNHDLLISMGGATDSVTVKSWFNTYSNDYKVEQIQFVDGTVWNLGSRTDIVNTVTGTNGNDGLTGYSESDVLLGLDGNDYINSQGGDDVVDGGSGDDTLYAGPGNDVLQGGPGNDTLEGSLGDDVLDGGDGNDTVTDSAGYSGGGNDTLSGGPGNDALNGGSGNDTYVFNPGDGQDVLTDYDYLSTNIDTLRLGAGIAPASVRLNGINNDLVISFTGSTDSMTVKNWFNGDNTYNKIETLQFADGMTWNLANRADLVNTVTGAAGNDSLAGWSEADILRGLDGNDTLNGQGGDDRIFGGEGDDYSDGGDPGTGPGRDYLDGGPGNDTLNGGEGDDVLLGGTGDDCLSGDDAETPSIGGKDFLDGGDGNDFLMGDGGAGADFLRGGLGDDVLLGGLGVDILGGRGPYYPSPLEGEGEGEGEAAMLIGAAGSRAI